MIVKEQQLGLSTDSLDHILLEQLHIAKRLKAKMKKARRVMGNDVTLIKLQDANDKRIVFFESMIQDKTLLHKKVKKKKRNKDPDLLARSTTYEWYRNIMIASNIGYKMLIDSFQSYASLFSKKEGKE